jgi:hypothetical protein
MAIRASHSRTKVNSDPRLVLRKGGPGGAKAAEQRHDRSAPVQNRFSVFWLGRSVHRIGAMNIQMPEGI